MAKKVTVVRKSSSTTSTTARRRDVSFALDGVAYEIDLSTANAASCARPRDLGRARPQGDPQPLVRAQRRVSIGPDPAAVRAWAKSNGVTVSERGRIPPASIEQFTTAGN